MVFVLDIVTAAAVVVGP